MRLHPSEGFHRTKDAENVLGQLRTHAGSRLYKAEIVPTLFARPDNERFQIEYIYHDPDKTPFQVRGAILSFADMDQLLIEGCVHEYSLGTSFDRPSEGGTCSNVTCWACKGKLMMPEERVIRFILKSNNDHLTYEQWPQKNAEK